MYIYILYRKGTNRYSDFSRRIQITTLAKGHQKYNNRILYLISMIEYWVFKFSIIIVEDS